MRSSGILALAGVSALAMATPAWGQSAPGEDSGASASSEIVVQARRKDESVQEVPLVVQAVSAQELANLNIREFKDIQNLVPGLQMSGSANGIGTQSSLRGVAYDVNASGNFGTVEFYLNDAHLSSGILFQSMFDVGQIEVLRGPQGTLRGRASPSGSITVTTRRPDLSAVGGYADMTVNSIGGWDVNGAINVPVLADKLAIRVAGLVSENEESRVKSINNPTKPSQKNTGLRASVLFEPFDGLTLFGSYTRTERDVVTHDAVESLNVVDPAATASPRLIRARDRLATGYIPRTYSQDFQVWNWQAEWRFAGQKLNYVGSISKQKLDSFAPNDSGGFFGPTYPASLLAAGMTTNTRGEEKNHEIRLSSEERVAGMFDYTVGYLWDKLDSPTDIRSQTPLFNGFFVPQASFPAVLSPARFIQIINTPITRRGGSVEKSIFANVTAHIGDATEISGGVRRIKLHSEASLSISGVPVAAANENRDLKAWIYSASVKHRFNDNIMAYASFGSSWRPGSATNPTIMRDNVAPSPAIAAILFPDPEKSKSYEIGIKTDWLDKRLRFNLTYYHQDFKNYAYSSRNLYFGGVNTSGAQTVFTAAPAIAVGVPAKVDGIEAEIFFQATDNWNLGAVMAYSKSKIQNGTVPCNDYFPRDGKPDATAQIPTYAQLTTANGGESVAFCNVNFRAGTTAPFSATLNTEYSLPLSDSTEAYLRGLLTYNGKSQNDPSNRFDDISAYALANLYLGLRDPDGAWDVGVFGKNVFGTGRALTRNSGPLSVSYVQLYCSPNPLVPVCPPGPSTFSHTGATTYRGVNFTNPREFGLRARFAFGSR